MLDLGEERISLPFFFEPGIKTGELLKKYLYWKYFITSQWFAVKNTIRFGQSWLRDGIFWDQDFLFLVKISRSSRNPMDQDLDLKIPKNPEKILGRVSKENFGLVIYC